MRSALTKPTSHGSAWRPKASPHSANGQIAWNGDGVSSGSNRAVFIHNVVAPGPRLSPDGTASAPLAAQAVEPVVMTGIDRERTRVGIGETGRRDARLSSVWRTAATACSPTCRPIGVTLTDAIAVDESDGGASDRPAVRATATSM